MPKLLRNLALSIMLLGAGTDLSAGTRTLEIKSSNPFNFTEAISGVAVQDIVLSVDLTLPDLPTPPEGFGAVLFVHGAGGPQTFHQSWLRFFLKQGYATAYANHFAPRKAESAVGDHVELTGAAMATDALNILSALAAQTEIDKDRIVIVGTSKGGGVALYTAWNPLRAAIARDLRFAAHLALYPTCMHWEEADHTLSPIRLIVGMNDDWTGYEQCAETVEALHRQGVDISLLSLDGAGHGFDSGLSERRIGNAFNVLGCRFSIGVDGADFTNGLPMRTAEEKRHALRNCISRGVTYGGDPAALEKGRSDVRAFLETVLG